MESSWKQMKNLVHRTVITKDPLEAISDYIQIQNEKSQSIKRYPKWDIPAGNSSAVLMRSRRELLQAENDLQQKVAERESKRKIMDQQWRELQQKQEELRDSFMIFDKFVKENDEKRQKATYTINEEKKRQENLINQIEEMTKKLDRMKNVKNKMQDYVQKYEIYQTYLERVVKETNEFQSIHDILNRYQILMEVRKEILENNERNLKILGQTGIEVGHIIEEKFNLLTGLNNELSRLQEESNNAKALAHKWETVISRVKDAVALKKLELTLIRECCWNMYKQMCKRKGIQEDTNRDNLEYQLEMIKRTILELNRIVQDCEKRMQKQ